MIPLPGSATLYRIGAVVALLVGIWLHGYHRGQQGPLRELAAVQAVATATDARYRQLESEVQHAQQAYVDNWRATRDASDAAWVRLKSASARRVPAVCPESGGVDADPGNGLEASRRESDRDLLPAVVGALETAERLEATLSLCQQELRQCAGLR
jgi:hypothetical protein